MHRKIAIAYLCNEKLKTLSAQDRGVILLSWWNIDESDDEYLNLPSGLKKEIMENESIPKDVVDNKYDPLIIEALKYDYIGVTNEYISKKFSSIIMRETKVVGDPETLFVCSCCSYRSLKIKGWDICPVCNWEDDGNDEKNLDCYSHPNHMTLAEARDTFRSKEISDDERIKYYKIVKPNIKP